MPSKKLSKKKQIEKIERLDHLTRRTVQVVGFGFAAVLLAIRITASIKGADSGISEIFIAGAMGLGASGSWVIRK